MNIHFEVTPLITYLLVVVGFCNVHPLWSQPGMTIASPSDGTVVRIGDTFTVTVETYGATFALLALTATEPLKVSPEGLATAPWQFSVRVPENAPAGRYALFAFGAVSPGIGADSEPISVIVEPKGTPTALRVEPSSLYLWVGERVPLRVFTRYALQADPSAPQTDDANVTLSSTIVYSSNAPNVATVSSDGWVTALSAGKATITAGSANVPVTVAAPIAILPARKVLYAGQTEQFYAQMRLLGSSDGSVRWSVSPGAPGSLDSSGTYVAPASITAQQQITLTATSLRDSSKSASATVLLYPPVSVSVAPATATLKAGESARFTAEVANTISGTAVTWSVSPAGVGTIDATGLYRAPSPISSDQTLAVTATSVDDVTKSRSATVTLRKSK